MQTWSLIVGEVRSSLRGPGPNHERSTMTRNRTDHTIRRAGQFACALLLLSSGRAVHGQRAFVLNAAPSVREAFAAPAPPPLLDRDYMRDQLRHARVLDAWVTKRFAVMDMFRARGVTYPAAEVYLRVFKRERVIELWARSPQQGTFTLVKEYPICALSELGPKRQQGDGQTPEGFYYVDFLNPSSRFHLSLHVNYPNAADQAVGRSDALGGDIFIHGGCLTAGCIAVTDESIKELYWIAVEARSVGQTRIPVHIFPARLEEGSIAELARVFGEDEKLVDFWHQLRGGYEHFERTHTMPEIRISSRGRYLMPGEVDPEETGTPVLGEAIASTASTLSPAAARAQGMALNRAPARTGPFVLGEALTEASFVGTAPAADSTAVGSQQR